MYALNWLVIQIISTFYEWWLKFVEHLGTDFLHFVLNTIEDPPNDDEEIVDTFMNLILAYNLQFKASDQNFTIQSLSEAGNAKVFTQKLIYLLNYESKQTMPTD